MKIEINGGVNSNQTRYCSVFTCRVIHSLNMRYLQYMTTMMKDTDWKNLTTSWITITHITIHSHKYHTQQNVS